MERLFPQELRARLLFWAPLLDQFAQVDRLREVVEAVGGGGRDGCHPGTRGCEEGAGVGLGFGVEVREGGVGVLVPTHGVFDGLDVAAQADGGGVVPRDGVVPRVGVPRGAVVLRGEVGGEEVAEVDVVGAEGVEGR